ncbi:MAG: hypothetical protein ILP19_05930 [Oscillospiraceae bacterium]|nr:hypothetical protein [Oscillospiraceae bacterium]
MKYYLIMIFFSIALICCSVYYGYTYYKYRYRSEERKLRVTKIDPFRLKTTTMYHVVGEMTDIPGIEMRSLEYYSKRKLKASEGDIITVRYISGTQFMIDPAGFFKNMVGLIVIYILAMVIFLFYK